MKSAISRAYGEMVTFKELLARVHAIRRRTEARQDFAMAGPIQVFFDGRDPRVKGEPLSLPRRERRMLEYFVSNKGRRLSKSQIFNAVYGLFDDAIEENVVESHLSKLRKKIAESAGLRGDRIPTLSGLYALAVSRREQRRKYWSESSIELDVAVALRAPRRRSHSR
jgi:DNA-binding response OmpR family regulator